MQQGWLWWYFALWVFVLGLCVGSFLNVCIWRIPRKLSLCKPPSHCPACNARLTARDLIPVASYVALRGRCRHCGAPIAPRYPAVELLTGFLYLLCYWVLPDYRQLLPALVLVSVLIPVAFIDAEQSIIPNGLMLFGLAAGLVCLAFLHPESWRSSLTGALMAAGLLFLVDVLSRLLLRKEGMGGGDVKLMAVVGLFLGLRLVMLALLLAVVAGGLVGAGLLLSKKVKPGGYFPFGPFLAVGSFVTLLFGEEILAGYMHWIQMLVGLMIG